jgi:hypothetical protein
MFLKPCSVLLLFLVLNSQAQDYEWLNSKIGLDALQVQLLRRTLRDFRLGNFAEILEPRDDPSSDGLLSAGAVGGSWSNIDFQDVACVRDLYDVLNGTNIWKTGPYKVNISRFIYFLEGILPRYGIAIK